MIMSNGVMAKDQIPILQDFEHSHIGIANSRKLKSTILD
jgi:hypothetical protein